MKSPGHVSGHLFDWIASGGKHHLSLVTTARPMHNRHLRTAVIGTGKISEEHLKFLGSDSRTELVAVCDLSPALAHYAARQFRAESAFTDHHAMLKDAKPDVVHVLTPPQTHLAIIRDCLDAGAHVVCEKPLAPTADELESVWQYATGRGRRLIENHNYRFNRPIRAMEAAVSAGQIGQVSEVEVRMCLGIRAGGRYADENLPHPSHRLPAGVLHEFLPHMVYLLLRFMPGWGDVRATWSNHGGGDLFAVDDLDALVMHGAAHGHLRFSTYQYPDCFTVTVRGSNGMLETDLFQPHVAETRPRSVGDQLTPIANQILRGGTLVRAGFGNFGRKLLQISPYEGLGVFLDETYRALTTGSELPVTHADMLETARLIDALVACRDLKKDPTA